MAAPDVLKLRATLRRRSGIKRHEARRFELTHAFGQRSCFERAICGILARRCGTLRAAALAPSRRLRIL
jgi:hypothetical protein